MYCSKKKKIGDNAIGTAKMSEWFFPFKHQETLVNVCKCSGCPTTVCTDKKVERVLIEDIPLCMY